MKCLSAIAPGLVLFTAGLVSGRYFFPKESATTEPTPHAVGSTQRITATSTSTRQAPAENHPAGSLESLPQLAQNDFPAAEKLARGSVDPGKRRSAFTLIARTLAMTNPDEALAWARALSPEDGRDLAVTTALQIMANHQPQHLAALIDADSSLLEKERSLAATIGREWIKDDQDAALAWLDALPKGLAKVYAY